MDKICVVLTTNKSYFNKFLHTCRQLLSKGKYVGNICLVIGDDLKDDPLLECEFIKVIIF